MCEIDSHRYAVVEKDHVKGDPGPQPRLFYSGLRTAEQAFRADVGELVSPDQGDVSGDFDPSLRYECLLDFFVQIGERSLMDTVKKAALPVHIPLQGEPGVSPSYGDPRVAEREVAEQSNIA